MAALSVVCALVAGGGAAVGVRSQAATAGGSRPAAVATAGGSRPAAVATAGGSRPAAVQVLGHIGSAAPFYAWLAMASNGRAAVLWALSPRSSGTPLELATAGPGGRFGPPQEIGKAPFGPLTVGLAIADSGAVVVAVGPDTGGLYVIRRSPAGRVSRAQHLVGRSQWIAGLSLAAGSGGAMCLAWLSQPAAAMGTGPDVARAAWLRPGASAFGRPLTVSGAGNLYGIRTLFVSRGRAAVAWTGSAAPGDPRQAELAFGTAGAAFGEPVPFASTTGILGDELAADGHGGVFAAVATGSLSSSTVALTALDVHGDGTTGPVSPVATRALGGAVQLNSMAGGRGLVSWVSGRRAVRAATLGPASSTPVPGSVPLGRGAPDYSLAVDPAGSGVILLSRGLPPTAAEPLPMAALSYRLVSATTLSAGASRAVGTALGDPGQLAIDDHGRAVILWVGPRAARGPVEVLRVRAP